MNICAYCNSGNVTVQKMERENGLLTFTVHCASCNKIDLPILHELELAAILKRFG
jgi:hypothetical protein